MLLIFKFSSDKLSLENLAISYKHRITLYYLYLGESKMNNVSFIISVDSSYEMLSNFFETFLNDDFVKDSEVVVVNDCVDNISILNHLNQLNNKNDNITVISLKTKSGYGIANNIDLFKKQEELLLSEKHKISIKVNEIISYINLYKALGGVEPFENL